MKILRAAPALALSLLLVFLPVAHGSNPVVIGKLSAEGSAQINGVAAPAGATVFDGDRISAAGKGLATLTLSTGNRVLVMEKSAAQVRRVKSHFGVAVERGTVGIVQRAGEPLLVLAGGLVVRPADESASYLVAIEGNSVTLSSASGKVTVEAANRSVTVESGKAMKFELAEAEPAAPFFGNSVAATAFIVTAVGVAALAIILPLAIDSPRPSGSFP